MTTSSETSRWAYSGNGANDTFAYSTEIFTNTDLDVYVDGTLKTITTHYTVTGVGSASGGNVVFTAGNIPASGTGNVVIVKDVPATQASALPLGGDFPSTTVEDMADKATIIVQQLKAKVGRTLRQPESDATDVSTIPVKATRASKYLSFDASGNPETVNTVTDITTVAGISASIVTVGTISANVVTVAGISANVVTVAGISASVVTVAGISGSVVTVASTSANIASVSANSANINTVAGISGNVVSVATISANVVTVAGISANVVTVAGISANVVTVAGISANVVTVAGLSADIASVALAAMFKYVFDNSTTMADPGTGEVRLNNATLASVTAIAISNTFSGGSDISDYIVTWDDPSHSPKSRLFVRKSGDADFFAIFNVTAVTDNTDWLQLTVTLNSTGGGTLSNGDTLYLANQPSGDDGAVSASFTTIAVAGQSDVVADSAADTLTLAAGSSDVVITTNAGADTITVSLASNVAKLATAQSFSKTQSVTPVALTSSAASIAVDLSLSNNFSHTFTENTTLANPSNVVAGTSGQIAFTQHASSPKTLAFGSNWDFVGGTAPSVTASNDARDTLFWYARTTTNLEAVLLKGWS